MRTAVPLPDPLAKRSFTLLESDAVGISRKRTRANDLRTVSRGIRVPVAADQPLAQRARPYLALLPDAVLSDITAAKLHGIPLPSGIASEELLHLTRPSGAPGIQRKEFAGIAAGCRVPSLLSRRGCRSPALPARGLIWRGT